MERKLHTKRNRLIKRIVKIQSMILKYSDELEQLKYEYNNISEQLSYRRVVAPTPFRKFRASLI